VDREHHVGGPRRRRHRGGRTRWPEAGWGRGEGGIGGLGLGWVGCFGVKENLGVVALEGQAQEANWKRMLRRVRDAGGCFEIGAGDQHGSAVSAWVGSRDGVLTFFF
jgi:hypothetical protein